MSRVGQARWLRWGGAMQVDGPPPFVAALPFTRERRPTAMHCLSHPTKRTTPRIVLQLFVIACLLVAPAAAQQTDSGVAALLALYELGPESFASVSPDATPDSAPALITALEVAGRIPPHKRLDWQVTDVDWPLAKSDPESPRGKLVLIQGRLQRVTSVSLPERALQRIGVSEVFVCELVLGNNPTTRATLFTRGAPARLVAASDEATELNERISTSALFINADEKSILLVADNIAWHPDTVDPALGVDAAQVWLANQGVDISSLDVIRDDAPLAPEDRAAFYQLLAAVRRWNDNFLKSAEPREIDLTELLRNPTQHRAQVYRLRGTARRAVPILVDNPEITATYGINRYYEVEVFLEPKMPIVIATGESRRRFDRYPIVFCCRELPEGMPAGESINEPVEVTGVFLKTWAYPSRWLVQQTGGTDQLQASPLLIGRSPKWLALGPPPLSFLERYGGWLFVAALVTLAAFVAWTARGDRQAKARYRERFDRANVVDLDQVIIETPPESPDEL